ncbi:hypothetical protein BHE74_00037133 [Ensete ventricosum]|nr:hypothetical protein BHE74_00037133 [Ensete ventricosum]
MLCCFEGNSEKNLSISKEVTRARGGSGRGAIVGFFGAGAGGGHTGSGILCSGPRGVLGASASASSSSGMASFLSLMIDRVAEAMQVR